MKSQQYTMRGTKRDEYLDYFEKIGEKREELKDNETCVTGRGWSVTVGPESEVRIGAMRFPEVPITITCEEEIFDEFIRTYRLKFMTAGG